MKKVLSMAVLLSVYAAGAVAAELTPYVGLGVVADKAGTSAKRVGFDSMTKKFLLNAGDKMNFDAAIAGEFTAGVKYGHLRGEVEVAIRSASEDDYELFEGNLAGLPPQIPVAPGLPTFGEVETTTSVKHNSFMFNMYYDFALDNPKWTPYVGAGIGLGVYKQRAELDFDFKSDFIPDFSYLAQDKNKKEFEWQVALGTAYHFTDDWALDVAYRFNSADVEGEFVYAHELKLGVRYSF